MTTQRKTITKKTRFEVFKRDSFSCQYCGAKAPDVVLHIDHIEPVSKGGDNAILNLITACAGCNSGKSDRRLADQATLTKQVQQLAELNERREQLKLMVEWRKGLQKLGDQEVDAASDLFDSMTGSHPTDTGRNMLRASIRKHGISAVLDAITIAVERHARFDGADKATSASAGIAFNHIAAILAFKAIPQEVQEQKYIFGILRNRFDLSDREDATNVVEHIKVVTGLVPASEVRDRAKRINSYIEWCEYVCEVEEAAGEYTSA